MILIVINRKRASKDFVILKHLDEIMSADTGYKFETFGDVGSGERVHDLETS
jgi:hypothetical protein